jgi:ribonuclease J
LEPGTSRQWIMVDCGVTFASEEHMPGVDLVFPDIGFVEEERANLLGIVLTHAHEDHYGALPDSVVALQACRSMPRHLPPPCWRPKLPVSEGRVPVPVTEVAPGGSTIKLWDRSTSNS